MAPSAENLPRTFRVGILKEVEKQFAALLFTFSLDSIQI